MALTVSDGPLSAAPAPSNYEIDGPKHRILFTPFHRRVRCEVAGSVVLDTVRGSLLHETAILPVLYAPLEDFDQTFFADSDTSTHCPFKGDASYWSLKVGDRVVEDAIWTYAEPILPFLEGQAAVYFDRVDRWLDEDVEVSGHLRDPYHRVDARPSSRRVRVVADGDVVAASDEPVLVFETSLPVRAYLDRAALGSDIELEPSAKRSHCPYKGDATYWSVRVGDRLLEDAAWSYEPGDVFDDTPPALVGRVAFLHDDLEVVLDV